MKTKYLALFILSICNFTFADVNPKINMPADFNSDNFIAREINDNSSISYNIAESSGCSVIKFKEYRLSPKNKVSAEENNPTNTFPVNTWVCLSSDTVYSNGYDRSMNEKIVYSRNKSLWVKANNKKSEIIPSDQDGPYKSLKLYNIKAKNAEGYVVFDENITKDDKETYKNAKKLVSFCLVQDSTYSALCGSGSLASDSSQIPYVLKTFESMEIGLDNKVNEKMLNDSNKRKVN